MKKIVYFDIDGTIYDFQNGILEDTKTAITKTISNGNYVCLCSGRSRSRIYDDMFMSFGIQGVIAAGGTYIEWDGEILMNYVVPPKVIDFAVSVLRQYHFIPVLDGPRYLYYDRDEYTLDVDYYQAMIEEKMGRKRLPITGNQGKMEVNKISAKKVKGFDEVKAINSLAPWFRPIIHEGITIEFVPHGYSKGKAAQYLAQKLGIRIENTFGFGDSMNDIELLGQVGHGVAMGSGVKKLREMAEFVTKHRLEGGIQYALSHYGLI